MDQSLTFSKSTKSRKLNKFLVKTFDMISDPRNSEIISWSDSGCDFEVKDPARFTQELLPKYFNHKNLASFIRQLNMYNFRKHKDNEAFIYMHPNFVKGQKDRLALVERQSYEKISVPTESKILKKKYKSVHFRQVSLQEKIDVLKKNYDDVVTYNQSLLTQIFNSKEREEKINRLLMMFITQVKEVPSFLKSFSEENLKFEIVKPIPIPLNHSIYLSTAS